MHGKRTQSLEYGKNRIGVDAWQALSIADGVRIESDPRNSQKEYVGTGLRQNCSHIFQHHAFRQSFIEHFDWARSISGLILVDDSRLERKIPERGRWQTLLN